MCVAQSPEGGGGRAPPGHHFTKPTPGHVHLGLSHTVQQTRGAVALPGHGSSLQQSRLPGYHLSPQFLYNRCSDRTSWNRQVKIYKNLLTEKISSARTALKKVQLNQSASQDLWRDRIPHQAQYYLCLLKRYGKFGIA